MNQRSRIERQVADFGQTHLGLVVADWGFDAEIEVEHIYDVIDAADDVEAYRLRSVLARTIATANPTAANVRYLGRIVRVRIRKVVADG